MPQTPGALAPESMKKRKKRPRMGIKLDRVDPRDFMGMNLIYACEQCSHYSASEARCSMGYVPQHTLSQQLELYNRTGFMAFCRFLEID